MELYKSATIASMSISGGSIERGNQLTTTLSANGLKNVYSADIILTYNKEQIAPISVNATGLAVGTMTESSIQDGVIRIMLASAEPLQTDGALFNITFGVADNFRGTAKSPIVFSELLINEIDMKAMTTETAIEVIGRPSNFTLNQNYPNPFNPSTTISYQVPEDGQNVRIDIYNIAGQLVRTLVDAPHNAGEYKVVWNGTNGLGQQVSSGVYLFRMASGNFVNVRKMSLVK